jgi:hypothetical protein
MARDQVSVACAAKEWTQLTNGDVTSITFQVTTGSVKIRCTADATSPAAGAAGLEYHSDAQFQSSGELRVAITSLAAGAGLDRVWARPVGGRPAIVVVDHA